MYRTTCRACGGKKFVKFLDLSPQPLAGGFLLPEKEAIKQEKLFPLPIHICQNCGLVQTLFVVPAKTLFVDYCFSSSTVPGLVTHFGDYAKWLKKKFKPEFVVEFGSNDGVLMEPLEKMGVKTCGVDISRNITKMAKEKGLNSIQGFFDEEMAEKIRKQDGRADIVTGSNAFPHNDHPEIILKAAKKVLKKDGHLCLEVMYLGDLLELLQWDFLYHEHLNYFCVTTLEIMLNRYGFHIVDVERLPMHAGSIRVVAAVDPKEKVKPSVKALLKYEKEIKITEIETWQEFGQKVQRAIEVTAKVMKSLSKNSRIWGYGASGRATMWVNACKMTYLEKIVDASPLRSGRLMPGTHTPIVFPEELKKNPPDYIFVTAWNYFESIKAKEPWFKGIWVAPAPELRFL
ncbi:MAG: class I SAM-dependent methyltransferase [Patescibacteria group bacterium]|nr:class I SAM-dependent methyltransferase [Patescibacteria group bacterium]